MPHSNRCLAWLSLLALVAPVACGGVSRIDGPGLGNGAAGSSSSGAEGAGRGNDELAGHAAGGSSNPGSAGSTEAGSGAPGSSAAGSSAAGATDCSVFKEDAPQTVTVKIRNGTQAPVYIGPRAQSCGERPLFEVQGVPSERSSCGGASCESYLDGSPTGGCPAACLFPGVTKLESGETAEVEWSGLSLANTQLPRECDAWQSAHESPVACGVNRRVQPGPYSFQATAGTGFTCDDFPNGCLSCQPSARGGCSLPAATVTGPELIAQITVMLDESYGVSGPGGADPSGTGNEKSVELVFLGLPP